MHAHVPPTAVLCTLAAIAVFLGCSSPPVVEMPAYLNNQRLSAPAEPLDDSTVYVRTLGLRPGLEDGGGDFRVDVLLRGRRAFEAARQWSSAPGAGGDANAILSVRRVQPQPRPLTLAFAPMGVTARALDEQGNESPRGISASDSLIMLTLHLESEPSWTTGTYDLMLQIPQPAQAAPWDIGDLTIHLEQKILTVHVTDTRRVPRWAR